MRRRIRSESQWSIPFLELLDLIGQCVDEVEEPLGGVVNQVVDDHSDGVWSRQDN